jgi:hypothetical protein
MSLTKRVGLLAGAGALTLAGGGLADTSQEAGTEQLQARIAELEARLAAVESKDSDSWLTEQRAAEIRGLVEEVLADADTRASLLSQGMQAGYDNGFVMSSADGNWLLRTNFLMQQRFNLNFQGEASPGNPPDADQWAFENTRSTITLSGNVVSPDWFYKLEINFGSNDGGTFSEDSRTDTLDAYAGYDFGNGARLYAGSFKAPFLREELIESMNQQTVERSNINYQNTVGRVDGIMFEYQADAWRAMGSYNDGKLTGQTTWSTAATEFAITGRGEFKVMGSWEQFDQFTSPPGSETGVLVGGAIHYQAADTDAGLTDIDLIEISFDGQVGFNGGNIYAAFIWNSSDFPAPFTDTDAIAFLIQGGYYIADTWELFGRYEWSDLDIAGVDDINIFTLGVTKYFDGQHAKWTTDIGIGLDAVAGAAPITGWRDDATSEDGQVVIRTQLQVAF